MSACLGKPTSRHKQKTKTKQNTNKTQKQKQKSANTNPKQEDPSRAPRRRTLRCARRRALGRIAAARPRPPQMPSPHSQARVVVGHDGAEPPRQSHASRARRGPEYGSPTEARAHTPGRRGARSPTPHVPLRPPPSPRPSFVTQSACADPARPAAEQGRRRGLPGGRATEEAVRAVRAGVLKGGGEGQREGGSGEGRGGAGHATRRAMKDTQLDKTTDERHRTTG